MNWRLLCTIGLLVPALSYAQEDSPPADAGSGAAEQHIAAVATRALVKVEYWLRADRGALPTALGVSQMLEGLLEEERPFATGGYLIAEDLVVTHDPAIHPRFVERIVVRQGEQQSAAAETAFLLDQPAQILKLERPLPGSIPFTIASEPVAPLHAVHYGQTSGIWTASIKGFARKELVLREGLPPVHDAPAGMIVDAGGALVAVSAGGELPADGSALGSPAELPALSEDQMRESLAKLERLNQDTILRVKLRFRSPDSAGGDPFGFSMSMSGQETSETEWNGLALAIDTQRILVLANLQTSQTARLDRISVFDASGEELIAAHAGSLEDYGAFIATLDTPVESGLVFSRAPIESQRDRLLLAAQVEVQSDTRTAYFLRARVRDFWPGWRGRLVPRLRTRETGLFMFDATASELLAFPIVRRSKPGQNGGFNRDRAVLTPAAHIAELLEDLEAHLDTSNVPVIEEDENRLAWLGVEQQALDRDLAVFNELTEETRGGEFGVIVSYVYPDSPAATIGLQMGDVLVRLHENGRPQPIEISLGQGGWSGFGGFRWEDLEFMPAGFGGSLPEPWPDVQNGLNKLLTSIGFGEELELEYFRDGERRTAGFAVEEGPPHFDSASRHKSDLLGASVRDISYEVRRYFQLESDDPGVIISKVEPGTKAAIAGLKPYEIIVSVDGMPVTGVEQFESYLQEGRELRLSVLRRNKRRIVMIRL